jgi:hypothetical protein
LSVVVSISYGIGRGADGFTPVTLSTAFDMAERNFKASMRFLAPELNKMFNATLVNRFAAEGRGGATLGKWVKLSKKYGAWKQRNFPGRKILTLRGHLQEGLTRDESGYAWRYSDDKSFSFGTQRIPYADYHQTGTRKMPARPPFDFGGARFSARFRAASQRGIVAALKDAGLRTKVTRVEGVFE